MTDTVTVYRWDDVDAPQITNASRKPSDVMKIMKACLVDGYGSKLGAGWSVVEDQIATATPYASFRNAGSGGAVLIRADNDNTGSAFIVRAYQEYTDLNNFAKESKSYSSGNPSFSSPNRKWVLIATNKAFWFLQMHPYYETGNFIQRQVNDMWVFFAGDIYSVFNNDPCTFTLIGGRNENDLTQSDYGSVFPYALTHGQSSSTIMYGLDNSSTAQIHTTISALGAGNFNAGLVNSAPPGVNVMADVFLRASQSGYVDYSGSPQNNSAYPILRGRLPGLFISDQSGWKNTPFPNTQTISGNPYLQIFDGWDDASAAWIKLDTWQ